MKKVPPLTRGSQKRYKLGFGCLVLLIVALVSVAIGGNMMLANTQSMHFSNQQPKEQALMAPLMRRKKTTKGKQVESSLAATAQKTKVKPKKQQPQVKRASNESSAKPQVQVKAPSDPRQQSVSRALNESSPTKQQVKATPPAEDSPAKATTKKNEANDKHSTVHVVFSTSCHVKQDWQSYLFFFQAMVHEQKGTVTRLVSGCRPWEQEKLAKDFQEKIAIMSDGFRIHFTPEFGRVRGKSFHTTKYWNKPFGLKHWFENALGFSMSEEGNLTSTTPYDDDVIVLVDPDMLMQRPFVNHFPEVIPDLWTNIGYTKEGGPLDRVSHGKPMAQLYGFGAQWLTKVKPNLTYVVGPDSPVHNMATKPAQAYYSAGPPYVVTARDMYQISYWWTIFLPLIFDLVSEFMAEMYGYSMAAAHLNLPHQLANGFMVSDAGVRGEGWKFMNQEVTKTVCNVSQFGERVPQVIHFCQRYSIGEFFLSKYKLPVEILSCDFPLLELPPLDIASYTNFSHYGDGTIQVWPQNRYRILYQNAYMVCALMPAINQAARYFKDHHCPTGANYNETWNTFTTDQEAMKKMLAAVTIGR